MTWRHGIAALLVAALPVAPDFSQSLGEAAQKEKQRRSQSPKGTASPRTYTDTDLGAGESNRPPPAATQESATAGSHPKQAAEGGEAGAQATPSAILRPPLSTLSGDWQGFCRRILIGGCSTTSTEVPPGGLGGGSGPDQPQSMKLSVVDAGDVAFEAAGLLAARGEGRISPEWTFDIQPAAQSLECDGQRRRYQPTYSGQIVQDKVGFRLRFQGEETPCPGECSSKLECDLVRVPGRR